MSKGPDEYGIDPPERADADDFQPPAEANGHTPNGPETWGRDREVIDYAGLQPPPEMLIQRPDGVPAEIRKKVSDALRLGLTERLAAQYAGLTWSRYLQYRKRDPDFADAIKQAEAIGAFAWMARIEQAAAGGDWRAAAWKLSHRFPAEYGREVVEHSGEGGGAIPVRFVTVEVPNGSAAEVSEGPDMPPLPEPDPYEDEQASE